MIYWGIHSSMKKLTLVVTSIEWKKKCKVNLVGHLNRMENKNKEEVNLSGHPNRLEEKSQ